jgi:hypothetical protein
MKMAAKVTKEKKQPSHAPVAGGNPGIIYGLGFVGALIYFIQTAGSFSEGLLGVLKAIVWPAVLTYRLFEFLNL